MYFQVCLRIRYREVFVIDRETYLLVSLVRIDIRISANGGRNADHRFHNRKTSGKDYLVGDVFVVDLHGIISRNFELDVFIRKQQVVVCVLRCGVNGIGEVIYR